MLRWRMKLVREKCRKLKLRKEMKCFRQIVRKKKVQRVSIQIGLNQGYHTTFRKAATNCDITQSIKN